MGENPRYVLNSYVVELNVKFHLDVRELSAPSHADAFLKASSRGPDGYRV